MELWWQNERGLADWLREPSTPEGVPLPSYRYKKGDEWVYIKKTSFFNVDSAFNWFWEKRRV
ncbi:hypothetical protein FGW80_15990 [Acinetobacter baumannii]|nr:hypothetical protein [Acinetobacter baumannii]